MQISIPRRELLPNAVTAVILSILNITFAISLAAFIFNRELSVFLPTGVGILLIATALPALIIGVGSSIPGVISIPKGNVCAVLSLMVPAIAAATTPSETLPTILAAIMISTILTGALLFLLGYLQIGNLFRFIPYPVIGGYFAGAGFLLVKGGIPVMADIILTSETFGRLFTLQTLMLWLPGVLFAFIVYFMDRFVKHNLVIPVLLITGVAGFYAYLFVSGTSVVQARAIGLLMNEFPGGDMMPPVGPALFFDTNYAVVADQAGNILTIMFLSAITALLIISGIEIGTEQDIDLDRDLMVAGAANAVTGLAGGTVGFHTAADTILGYRLGGRHRIAGILYGAICGAVLFLGPKVITFFPKPIMGGLLIYQGLDLLITWAYDSRKKLPLIDYILVLAILVVVVFMGFLQAVAVGILIAAGLFVINYSRSDYIRHALSGKRQRSKVMRGPAQEKVLNAHGEKIYTLALQGYLFFGTSDRLLQHFKQQVGTEEESKIQYVVFDFHLVTDIDISAANSFVRMKQFAASRGITLVFSSLSREIKEQLERSGFFGKEDKVSKKFADFDHALEWCEEAIIEKVVRGVSSRVPIREILSEIFDRKPEIALFRKCLKMRQIAPGDTLFKKGDEANSMFFIESGKITILIVLGKNNYIRLQTLGGGTVFGEMGLYSNAPRSATAVARQASVLYELDGRYFALLQKKYPKVAAKFQGYIISTLAARLATSNQTLQSMMF